MAGRLRLLAASLIFVAGPSLPAGAVETWTCWSETTSVDGGSPTQVTRCRLAGHDLTTDYATASQVPVVLSPRVGSDDGGLCWYWTSRPSDWVLLGVDDDGVATLGIDPGGEPGGPIIIDAAYPRCTSEPADTPSVLQEAWELLSRYDHPTPRPQLDPPPGAGVTGMQVFVVDAPPAPWSASLVSPHTGMRIEVETRVEAIEVDWGDGEVTTIPAEAFPLLSGWPDGAFGHVYEVKTCREPGGSRCHPTLSEYRIEISYVWSARYRAGAGAWSEIPVPATAHTAGYDVDEIVPVITAVG
ncbi:MAG TPA: hypothetical protein VLB67_04905 [Acidimicrobiia bacterium]|nr:hypothetical protein [Acidimicrobiia bacterium]